MNLLTTQTAYKKPYAETSINKGMQMEKKELYILFLCIFINIYSHIYF